MFLSQLVLDRSLVSVQRELGNAHRFHQRIMQAFPDDETVESPRQDWNILFRHEPANDVILVQSDIEPDWTRLPLGYLQRQVVKTLDYKTTALQPGRVLQFRLKANPSKRENKTRKVVGLVKPSEQLAWLTRQGDRCGFKVIGADTMPLPKIFGKKKKSPIRIETALYHGLLEVTDADLFVAALRQGIGKGKSYGCGLLSVARYSQ